MERTNRLNLCLVAATLSGHHCWSSPAQSLECEMLVSSSIACCDPFESQHVKKVAAKQML